MCKLFIGNAQPNEGAPVEKKLRKSQKLDAFEATNYLPILSEEEKQVAENELGIQIDMSDTASLDRCFFKTRAYQRQMLSETVEWHLKTFAWLQKVRFV